MGRSWGWRILAAKRVAIGRANNEPCCRCHNKLGPIRYDQPGTKRLGPTADHLDPLAHGGNETPPLHELGVAHRTCNSRHGSAIGNSRQGLGPGSRGGNPATYTPRKKTPRRKQGTPDQPQPASPQFSPNPSLYPAAKSENSLPQNQPITHESRESDPEFGPGPEMFTDLPWLAGLFPMPAEAVWPRLMSAPHPRAVGSYGTAAIDWIEARRAADPRVPARAKRLRWFQKLALLRQWEHDDDGQLCWSEYLLAVSRQVGKDLDCATPILTANRGWITMGDLVSGDEVFAPDGSPTLVIAAHPPAFAPFGAFQVTLTDGRSLVAGGAHLWEVFDHHGAGRRRVMTTSELLAEGVRRARTTTLAGKMYTSAEYRFRMSDQGGMALPEVSLPLDPWLLGYWLGNGTSIRAELTVGDGDQDHVTTMVEASGAHVLSTSCARAWRIGFSTMDRRAVRLPGLGRPYEESALSLLRDMGLLGAKHIPQVYLTAALHQRLRLLRGLMDSDGHAPKSGTALELTFINERLAMDAVTLIRSLGYQPRWSKSDARLDGRYISQRWRIRFSVPEGMPNPFTLPRKAKRVRITRWRKRPSIASIVPVPDRWMRCITVDRADGMFLAGRELVPTHNSVLLSERSMCRVELFPELAGEPQLVMQVSKDLSAAREVQRLVRLWAGDQEEAAKAAARNGAGKLPPGYRPRYHVRGTHGQEEIECPDGSRYMIRGRDSVYSYSVSAAELDEAWGVRPDVVFDGIEPTMAERELGQLCLTSTAHPRATALFPARRGLAVRDLFTPGGDSPLLLEWSAHRSWDAHVVDSWRAASPHWDARRLRVVSRAHERWATGAEDERTRSEGGFPYQYLNMWPSLTVAKPWLAEVTWSACARVGLVVPADRAVVGVSLDSGSGRWPVVVAGRVDGGIAVALVGEFASLDEALMAAGGRRGSGCALLTPRGLRGHAVLRGVRETVHVHEGDVTAAQDLCRAWITAGRLLHASEDVGVTGAVLARPFRREVGRFDTGTLVLLCAWWAGRERPRSAAA